VIIDLAYLLAILNYNHSCLCAKIDFATLYQHVPLLAKQQLFASWPTYVTNQQALQMRHVIQAIEHVIQSQTYKQTVLARAPAIAHQDPGATGVFMGYDFHLSPQGPQLIEINTNAGGALLNGLITEVNQACCVAAVSTFKLQAYEQQLLAMFKQEWKLQRGAQALKSIAIVDHAPMAQHLYPEFTLFQQLFESHGIKAIIADPQELVLKDQRLYYGDLAVDLIYNRLTDFYLSLAEHAHIAEAYLADQVVLTPHPNAYALYADKRNLALLSNAEQLAALGVSEAQIAILLQAIPPTFMVQMQHKQEIWQQRKTLFFKPVSGYGGRGSYRGDRITHKTFDQLMQHDYIAQGYAEPSERIVEVDGQAQKFKIDVRNYVYQGQVQLLAARLYRGQTTNFRIPGSGFSPVVLY
jgi:hypothetical protein